MLNELLAAGFSVEHANALTSLKLDGEAIKDFLANHKDEAMQILKVIAEVALKDHPVALAMVERLFAVVKPAS